MPKFSYVIDTHAECDKVYSILKNISDFSSFMKSVKEINILNKNKNILIVKWNVLYDGVSIEWTEEIIYNDNDYSLKFKSLSGNYSRYGEWKVFKNKKNNKTSVSLDITYDWDAPNFEHFFGDIYKEKAEKATKGMLYALKRRLSK